MWRKWGFLKKIEWKEWDINSNDEIKQQEINKNGDWMFFKPLIIELIIFERLSFILFALLTLKQLFLMSPLPLYCCLVLTIQRNYLCSKKITTLRVNFSSSLNK